MTENKRVFKLSNERFDDSAIFSEAKDDKLIEEVDSLLESSILMNNSEYSTNSVRIPKILQATQTMIAYNSLEK